MIGSGMLAALLLQAGANMLPPCGSFDRDIGRGFQLSQPMYGGSREFTLTYRPGEDEIRLEGVSDAAPFRFRFGGLHVDLSGPLRTGTTAPSIGLAGYRFTRPDGSRIGLGSMRMDCGEGIVLRARFSTQGSASDAPLTIFTPFLNQREHECVLQLAADGQFSFSLAESDDAEPWLYVEGRMELGWALAETERVWRSELDRAGRGECRLSPHVPPPF